METTSKKLLSTASSVILVSSILAAGAFSGHAIVKDINSAPVRESSSETEATETELPISPSTPVAAIPPELDKPDLPAPVDIPADTPSGQGSFTMTGAANMTLNYASMPYVLPLNPLGPQESMVRWVDGLGVQPNDAEDGTTYVLGHAWSSAPLAFNPISQMVTGSVDFSSPTQAASVDPGYLSIRYDRGHHTDTAGEYKPGVVPQWHSSVLNGSHITMADGSGESKTWVVDDAWLVDKFDALQDPGVMGNTPGKIVLIACSVDGNLDLGYNVIVTGHLV